MKIIGLNTHHNSSITSIENGEIIFHIENERLSNIKYDTSIKSILLEFHSNIDNVEHLGLAGLSKSNILDITNNIFKNKHQIFDMSLTHHLLHASHGFYNSGFEKALCIVKYGMGSDYKINDNRFDNNTWGRERNATFIASYPQNFEEIDKEVFVSFDTKGIIKKNNVKISNHFSEGLAFQKTCIAMGLNELDAGKIMGMSAYGKPNTDIPPIYVNRYINTNLFKRKTSLRA